MRIPKKTWNKYITDLRKISDKAAELMTSYLETHDVSSPAGRQQAIEYAYALATKYGEGTSALACEMYDSVVAASGKKLPPAEPAATATFNEVARTVNGSMLYSKRPDVVGSSVGRLVKTAGVDTTMRNAIRDGAEWAWVPSGDTCAFCIALASQGWVKASEKVMKGNHAEHIHNNCDCTFSIRFDGKSSVEGYDPDALRRQYYAADGSTPTERINAMRRAHYAANKDAINAQKRVAYAARIERQRDGSGNTTIVNLNKISEQSYRMKFRGITGDANVEDAICDYSRKILEHRSGTRKEDLVLLDASTGKRIHLHDRSTVDSGVEYDEMIENAIREAQERGQRIISIHNHPNGLPPTLDDGSSAFAHGYHICVVVGHDGSVYQYTAANRRYSPDECKKVHDAISYQIKTGASQDEVWYNMLKEFGMIIKRR